MPFKRDTPDHLNLCNPALGDHIAALSWPLAQAVEKYLF